MRLYKFTSYLIIAVLLPLFSCQETIIEKAGEGKLYSIEGHAQKGPFIVGTDVTVAELNDKLFPTGRVFFSTILDNEGRFELPGVVLESPYIQIKVTGKYFSETQNNLVSEGTITLFSIADIRKTETINVNILTHLEKERVEYLVQKDNKTFSEAKEQALNELLSIFNLQDYQVESSEGLTILDDTEGNGLLLAISSIIEGLLEYEMRLQMITVFQKDFEDGELNDHQTQKRLITSAKTLDIDRIIGHLNMRYPNSEIPEFGSFISHFIQNTTYVDYFRDAFPEQLTGWVNLLEHPNIGLLNPNIAYNLQFDLPENVPAWAEVLVSTNFYQNQGAFDAASPNWVSVESVDCAEPNCISGRNYYFNSYPDNLKLLNATINRSGLGERLFIRVYISIDGFTSPLSGDWNLDW